MAHYQCRIATPLAVQPAFDYMAEVQNFAEWDPGVVSSKRVSGSAPGRDAAYDVVTSNGGREMEFHYVTTEFAAPNRFVVVGKKFPFTSVDVVDVEPDGAGSIVTYTADLTMPFPLSLAEGWLTKVFRRIGDAAARGLASTLGGEWLR